MLLRLRDALHKPTVSLVALFMFDAMFIKD